MVSCNAGKTRACAAASKQKSLARRQAARDNWHSVFGRGLVQAEQIQMAWLERFVPAFREDCMYRLMFASLVTAGLLAAATPAQDKDKVVPFKSELKKTAPAPDKTA